MPLLYRQEQWGWGFYKERNFQLSAASTPQLGEDQFVVCEEVLIVRRYLGCEDNPRKCLQAESRTKPLTTLAWGESGLSKKHVRQSHTVIMGAGAAHREEYRVRSAQGFADQGTESGFGEVPEHPGNAGHYVCHRPPREWPPQFALCYLWFAYV